MMDEIFDRSHRAARKPLNTAINRGLARASHAILDTFSVLQRIQFDAPWTKQQHRDAHCG